MIKAHATKLASYGYRCLVPDLYHGKIGVDKEEASHLFGSLDWQRAVVEVTQAVDYLKETGSAKVGAVGFCMGGALSLAAAQHSGVAAAQPFYGLPSPQICSPEAIKVPVRMHFGELDLEYKGFADPDSAKAFADGVNAAEGGAAELFIYENCGHAFLNLGDEGVAKREHMGFPHPPVEQQALAWERLTSFFDSHLKA